ncbi:MAG: fumarate hydratase [Bacteroidetes bacterium]|nr:fumarate hydratase [Bacteroidota bacterium]
MQRHLRFLLSSFCFLLGAISFASCSFNANVQGKGEAYLQGEWRQDSVPMQRKLTEYSLYEMTFSCDSFYMKISSFSKVNNGADACTESGRWTEYTKGTYRQGHDTLRLRGQFCNANHSLKQEGGCFRSGDYDEDFVLKKKNDSLLEFLSTTSDIPIEARLIKHTTCNPKPL